MKKLLLVPDSFKGTLSSRDVARAMTRGIERSDIEIMACPMADGGEGSLEAIHSAAGGDYVEIETCDARQRPIKASYLRLKNQAFVELAYASGLTQIERHHRSAGSTTTLGSGHLIAHALQNGVREVTLCIGGSATNDAGAGIAAALGFQFFDHQGQAFLPTGFTLAQIYSIRPPEDLPDFSLRILCDVSNPFVGSEGAVYTFASQKGASLQELQRLENGMNSFAQVLINHGYPDVRQTPGAGAAGGTGGGLLALLGAKLVSGIDFIMDTLGVKQKIAQADLILTGEGKLDQQTLFGKTIRGIVEVAKSLGRPVVALCGVNRLSPAEMKTLGVQAIFEIHPNANLSWEEVKQQTPQNITRTTSMIIAKYLERDA